MSFEIYLLLQTIAFFTIGFEVFFILMVYLDRNYEVEK